MPERTTEITYKDKLNSGSDFYVAGLDWGEAKNFYAIVNGKTGETVREGTVVETPASLALMVRDLHHFADPDTGELPPVAMESPRRLIVQGLRDAGAPVIPLSPIQVKTARGMLQGSRTRVKTDKVDAILIAQTLRLSPRLHHAVPADTVPARAIALLAREHRDASRELLRRCNRLRSCLTEFYPAALDAFTAAQFSENAIAATVLHEYPTPGLGLTATADRVAELVIAGGRVKAVQRRVDQILPALHSERLRYPEELEAIAYTDVVRMHCRDILQSIATRDELAEQLEVLVLEHPLFTLLSPAVGMSPTAIGRLISEIGDDPRRFTSADGLAAFAGNAPSMSDSGSSRSRRRRDVKGNDLHRVTWMWAMSALMYAPGAKEYYWQHRLNGDPHNTAVRKLAGRLSARLYYCITRGVVWDEAKAWPRAMTPEQVEAFVTAAREELAARKKTRRGVA